MKKIIILGYCLLLLNLNSNSQFGRALKKIVQIPDNSPVKVKGRFKKSSDNNVYYYKFVNPKIKLCYYPKQTNVQCGRFNIFGQNIYIEKSDNEEMSCDLDYGSFEVFNFSLNNKQYLIVNGIRYGSGMAANYVYLNIFDISNKDSVISYQVSSFYGSEYNIGDFNSDGNLDYLKISYDTTSNSPNNFVLYLMSLDKENQRFNNFQQKYKKFNRTYDNNNNLIFKVTASSWF